MTTETLLAGQIEFLRARIDRDVAHSWSSLLEHLLGTREMLVSWEAELTVCTAGLFHSVYGTESFDRATIDRSEREAVRLMIGEEAEQIVYLFSIMTGESFEASIGEARTHRIKDRIDDRWIMVSHPVFVRLCNLSAPRRKFGRSQAASIVDSFWCSSRRVRRSASFSRVKFQTKGFAIWL